MKKVSKTVTALNKCFFIQIIYRAIHLTDTMASVLETRLRIPYLRTAVAFFV